MKAYPRDRNCISPATEPLSARQNIMWQGPVRLVGKWLFGRVGEKQPLHNVNMWGSCCLFRAASSPDQIMHQGSPGPSENVQSQGQWKSVEALGRYNNYACHNSSSSWGMSHFCHASCSRQRHVCSTGTLSGINIYFLGLPTLLAVRKVGQNWSRVRERAGAVVRLHQGYRICESHVDLCLHETDCSCTQDLG